MDCGVIEVERAGGGALQVDIQFVVAENEVRYGLNSA
jgi:hypothetical protein